MLTPQQSGPSCSKLQLVKINQNAKFEVSFKNLQKQFIFILFVHNLMIGYSKENSKNYPGKCF